MIQQFEDGAILYTGQDMLDALTKSFNCRNNYHRNTCSYCVHDGNDDMCDGCSVLADARCSCHIAPPCSFCVNTHFEPSPYLINYKHYTGGKGKWRWECFKSNESVFNKMNKIEDNGYVLEAETLSTGGISVEFVKNGIDVDGIIYSKKEFKIKLEKAIINFGI